MGGRKRESDGGRAREEGKKGRRREGERENIYVFETPLPLSPPYPKLSTGFTR